MWNSLQLKQYQNTTLTNIFSSQFVYARINEKCEIKKQELIIENKKNRKIYYLYLFLTAKKKPYVQQQSIVTKNMKKNLNKPKIKSITWKVDVKKNFSSKNLSQILFQMIALQTNSEKKILKLNGETLSLIVHYAPITAQTVGFKVEKQLCFWYTFDLETQMNKKNFHLSKNLSFKTFTNFEWRCHLSQSRKCTCIIEKKCQNFEKKKTL